MGAESLHDLLTAPAARPAVVRACTSFIEAEVASKRGFTGAAVKAAFAVVKAIKPGIVGEAVDKLLPDFARALEPWLADARGRAAASGTAVASELQSGLTAQPAAVAEALLSVTDDKARAAKNKTMRTTYERMRGGALEHVTAAVPGLAQALAPFVPA